MSDFLVKRDDLRTTRIADSDDPPNLNPGELRLKVDTFGLTANNITYAVFGDQMAYWKFFPGPEGWGRVPMWGFADVEESQAEDIGPGTRVYGYLPPSTHLVVTPAKVDPTGFNDGSPHRAELPAAYQRYSITEHDPFYRADTEAIQMLLRPLFITSFLIDDQIADTGFADYGPVVISSASSKTAIGVAFLLAQREEVEVIGLTSPHSRDFVDGLGVYDRTVTYDALASLPEGPATFVDIAGDSGVRHAIHSHYLDDLLHSMAVGVTHWEAFPPGQGALPGPFPIFFFAPDRIAQRSKDWGPAGLQTRVADAWHAFAPWTAGWLDVQHERGFEAVERVYLEVLEGRITPTTAHVLSLP